MNILKSLLIGISYGLLKERIYNRYTTIKKKIYNNNNTKIPIKTLDNS